MASHHSPPVGLEPYGAYDPFPREWAVCPATYGLPSHWELAPRNAPDMRQPSVRQREAINKWHRAFLTMITWVIDHAVGGRTCHVMSRTVNVRTVIITNARRVVLFARTRVTDRWLFHLPPHPCPHSKCGALISPYIPTIPVCIRHSARCDSAARLYRRPSPSAANNPHAAQTGLRRHEVRLSVAKATVCRYHTVQGYVRPGIKPSVRDPVRHA